MNETPSAGRETEATAAVAVSARANGRRWAVAGAIVGSLLAVAAGISIWRELHPQDGSESGVTSSAVLGSMLAQSTEAAPAPGRLRVDLAFEPESVTVGEPFHAAVRVTAQPGIRVEYGDFTTNDSVQAIAPVQLSDTIAGSVVAIYPLVAWVADEAPDETVPIRLIETDGTVRTQEIRLALPGVTSVLPAGAEISEIPPKPVKGVFVPPGAGAWPWWWWIVALVAAITGALLYWWVTRKRPDIQEEPVDPAEWALGQLATLQPSPDASPAEIVLVYRRSSAILRGFLSRRHANLGLDLTTSELSERVRLAGEMDDATRRTLRSLLDSADRVKFAGLVPPVTEAISAIEATRTWIVAYVAAGEEAGQSPQRAA